MTRVERVPDGRRWLMWALPTLLFVIAFFHRPAPGVIAKDLMRAFGATGTTVGLLSATYFYSYAGLMIPAGLLVDAYGVRWVVGLGGVVMGAGALAMAVAWDQALLFSGRFIVGLGAAVTFVGSLKIAATWFPAERFGTLSALTATAGVLGSFLATAPLAWAVALLGWRGAFIAVAAATFVGAALCMLIVRDRPAIAGSDRVELAEAFNGMFGVLRNRHTWPPFVSFFFLYATMGNLMLWIVPYLRDVYGVSTTTASLYATATSLPLLFAGPLTGYVSDRIFKRRKAPYLALICAQFVTWSVFILTLGALPLTALYALLFAMGTVGGAFVLTWPIGREVNPPHLAGVAVAVVNLGGFLGAALTQGPLGSVLDATWTGLMASGARLYPLAAYRTAFMVCAAFVLGAAAAALFVRETRGENIYGKLVTER